MNKIIAKKYVSENLVKLEIKTSIAASEIKPGQYLIFRIEETGPRIPLSTSKTDIEKETLTVFVPITDISTRKLANLNVGSQLFGIDGPFGYPMKMENFGTVLCVCRGLGIAPILPALTSLRASGNRVVTIMSAQTKEGIILEPEIRAVSDDVLVLTEDGSWGDKGTICQEMRKILTYSNIKHVFVTGSAQTIKESCSLTRKYNIPTQAILYSGKPDESGLNGVFRVSICCNGKSVCVDGDNFNAYYNDFEELVKRFGYSEVAENQSIVVSHEENIPV
jgi:glutamate synthase (NADPH/NADH) small chain